MDSEKTVEQEVQDIDWVGLRLQCEPESIYAILRDRLERDANSWKGKTKKGTTLLDVTDRGDSLVIERVEQHKGWRGNPSLVLTRRETSIRVLWKPNAGEETSMELWYIARPDEKGRLHFLELARNPERNKLELKEDGSLVLWQLSKKLLEPILFPGD